MNWKALVLILAIAAVGGAAYYWRARPAPFLTLTGIVTEDGVVVSSQIAGRLSQLLVKEGDPVKRGQLLASIEPQEFKAEQAYYVHTEEGLTAQVREAEHPPGRVGR